MAKAHSAVKTLGFGAAWAAAAAALIGFFLPWAAMDVSGSTISKTLHKTGLTEPLGYMTAKVRHGSFSRTAAAFRFDISMVGGEVDTKSPIQEQI